MNRHNLKRHTLEYHKEQAVSERIVGVLPVDSFFINIGNESNKIKNSSETENIDSETCIDMGGYI